MRRGSRRGSVSLHASEHCVVDCGWLLVGEERWLVLLVGGWCHVGSGGWCCDGKWLVVGAGDAWRLWVLVCPLAAMRALETPTRMAPPVR